MPKEDGCMWEEDQMTGGVWGWGFEVIGGMQEHWVNLKVIAAMEQKKITEVLRDSERLL